MKHLLWLLAIVFLAAILSPPALAQNDEEEIWEDVKVWQGRRPYIGLDYGASLFTLPGLTQELARTGMLELRLGSTRTDPLEEAPSVLHLRRTALGIAMIGRDLGPKADPPSLATTSWRVAVWRTKGLGYALDGNRDAAIFLTAGGAVTWTRLGADDPVLTTPDRDLLALWDGSFRFGTVMEAGAGIRILPLLTVNAGFERSLVFRRHLFGKWLGSFAIEGAATWALDSFIRRIERSSPEAVPVVFFVLRNALAYGFTQLRREKMNWPFESEPPLLMDTFRVGMSFEF